MDAHLMQRIADLEKRVAALEARQQPASSTLAEPTLVTLYEEVMAKARAVTSAERQEDRDG